MEKTMSTIPQEKKGNVFKKLFSRNETIILLTILVLSLIIGSINNVFFTLTSLYETLKASVVLGIVAIGVGIVMISGGVDLSCMAIAMFSAYTSLKIVLMFDFDPPIILIFAIAMIIGALLGLLNGLFIAFFKVPIFIATLCTSAIFKGILLEFIGNIYITPAEMPQSVLDFFRSTIFGGLHISALIMVALMVFSYFLLRYTVIGRGVFAVGGDIESAERIGYNTKRVNFSMFAFTGVLYAIGGAVYVFNSKLADPYDMIGTELSVIAAVVLGGVSISGGKGSMLGIALGTLLTVIIKNNLILIGVGSDWSNFVFGLIFILAIALQAYNRFRLENQND